MIVAMPYIYKSAFYCEDCRNKITVTEPGNPGDSDSYPIYVPDTGESDSPCNCEQCGMPLPGTLTEFGVCALVERLREEIQKAVNKGRSHWNRIMPDNGTAEEQYTYWHGSKWIAILRQQTRTLDGAFLNPDQKAIVNLFLDLSE